MDCNGHGSHVAGTAAGYGVNANGTTYVESGPDTYAALKDLTSSAYVSKFRIGPGVAPKASLYGLRVFGCSGSTDVVVAALEWAMDPDGDGNISDHLDVVNMSLGSPYGSVTDPDAVAADNAAKAGIVVVASAGNSGDVYYVTGSPAVSPYTLSVASSVDAGAVLSAFEVTANTAPSALVTPNKYPASLALFGPQTFNVPGDLAYFTTADLGCAAYPAGTFTGKIALINRGTCLFDVKVTNAQNAGAIGVLLANNTDAFPGAMGASGTVPNPLIPVMMTTKSLGTSIKTDMAAGTVTVLLTSAYPNSVFMSDPTVVDTVSSFSSRGPARGGTNLKPDISAPGDSVFSTAVFSGNAGESLSGTSMAAPHMAGVMALLRQIHPDWTVSELKALAMNTASHELWTGLNQTGLMRTPTRQGAGRVDVPNASLSNVVAYNKANPEMVSVSYGFVEVVNSLAGVDKTITKSIILSNMGGSAEAYNITFDSRYTSVLNPGLTFTILNADNTAISNPVTVPAYGTLEIKVKVDIDAAALTRARDATISTANGRERFSEGGGYVVLTSTATAPMVRVPVHIAARPASSMGTVQTQINLPAPVSGTLSLTPSGIPVDTATDGSLVYISELLYQSPNETSSTFSNNAADLKYIGATSDFAGAVAGKAAFFSIATYGEWDTLSSVEFDVYIDINEDGTDDYVLYSTNSGTSSSPTDTMVSVLCDLPVTGCFIEDFINWFGGGTNTNAFQNNALTMNLYLSDIGLLEGVNTDFNFYVVTWTREAAGYVDISDILHYDVANQSFGTSGILGSPAWKDNILYSPTLDVSYNKTNIEANGSTGLLLLHQHNATNTAQVIPLAPKIFTDVPLDYFAAPYIDRLFNAGITAGCGGGNFCPNTNIPRDQMAVLLVRAKHGPAFVPPTATGIFADVPVGSFGADFIEQLAADGITSGCGGGNYCPSGLVTRAEMAIFLIRATHGIAFVPPTATGIFADVPVGSFGANFIEQLAADGVTAGCGGGNYCPGANITRAETAILFVKAFNLPFNLP
jgi:subtilisin family serine protease